MGRIVFALVQAELLSPREGESEANFAGLFALDGQALPESSSASHAQVATGAAPRRGRRWFQFTLGSMLGLVLLAALVLGVWRMYLGRYRGQAEAIDLIERLGGTWQAQEAPAWESRVAGFPLRNVTLVNLADCDQPDDYLDSITSLPSLQVLVVGGQNLADEHVAKLAASESLRWLVLDSAAAGDEAVARLQQARPGLDVHRSDRRLVADLHKLGALPVVASSAEGLPPLLGELLGDEFSAGVESVTATSDVQIALLPRASRVTDVALVSFVNDRITAAGLAHLSRIKGLENVDVSIEFSPAMLDEIPDVELARLRDLSSVRSLKVSCQIITDAGLGHVATLENLKTLELTECAISDVGMHHLAKLKRLTTLNLRWTKITGAGLAYLPQKLEHLDLSFTRVNDDGLARLPSLPNLDDLDLSDTQVTDAGLAHLSRHSSLGILNLSGTHVTDAGRAHLASIKSLRQLYLGRTAVTDAALPHLARLTNLEILVIRGTTLRKEAIAKALPKCHVE